MGVLIVQGKKKKILAAFAIIIALLLSAFLGAVVSRFYYSNTNREHSYNIDNFATQSLYPVQDTLALAGYIETTPYNFIKQDSPVEIVIGFDFINSVCYKNQYAFDMAGKAFFYENNYYVHESVLSSLLNVYITQTRNGFAVEPIAFAADGWLQYAPLIAHAGGGLRLTDGCWGYQNTLEAVVQNYELGHRVFELDFQITADNDVAVVHDGLVPGDENGIEMTAEEWKYYQGFKHTTLLIDDVLKEMLVNKDMFVVTDTKWMDNKTFELIYEHAMQLDPELLNRFIPQIYAIDMYEPLMLLYSFPSVIYTTYASPDTVEEIVAFAAEVGNIHVITTPMDGVGIQLGITDMAATEGIHIYIHTLNDPSSMFFYFNQNITGFYTDYITPELYHQYIKP